MSFKFNPLTGNLDITNKNTASSTDAEKIVMKRDLSANTSALKLVCIDASNQFVVGDPSNYQLSQVVGVTLQAGLAGSLVSAHLFGKLDDPFFTFPLHDSLYLGSNGVVTNIVPIVGHDVLVGHSLGNGSIFINIQEPLIL